MKLTCSIDEIRIWTNMKNSFQIRVSDEPVNAHLVKADIFMSLDNKTEKLFIP